MLPQGTTLKFRRTAYSVDLLSLSIELARDDYEVTKFDDAAVIRRAGDLIGPLNLNLTVAHDPDAYPPIIEDAEPMRITWPAGPSQTVGARWEFTAFATEYEPASQIGARMEASMSMRISGDITTKAARKGFVIAPTGLSDHSAESEANKAAYGFIADSGTGLMPNGDAPYEILEGSL